MQPFFLQTPMKICNQYGLKWRYVFNNSVSGVATFVHSAMAESETTESKQANTL